ncbi:hypothetical protein ACIBHY_18050 [Nonomuraea sp. NPDC050547]|uniref:hypothetical protein n=1 Tax=Nonomuraea sp. NPDC050547 TaxID=3364368 RepID=UPI0037A1F855
MGLRGWLLRRAASRPAVLVVAGPYGTRLRLLVEACGWPQARSPAAAAVLVTCGPLGERLAAAADTVWNDVPGPRARVSLPADATAEEVRAALERARESLADETAQLRDAAEHLTTAWRPEEAEHTMSCGAGAMLTPTEAPKDEHGPSGGHSGGPSGGSSGGHSGGSSGGHEGHMGVVGGVAMAGRGPDRDGLMLDRLHVPLGPVLADWPDGLVVETVMQGDVIQRAVVVTGRPGAGRSFWDEPWLAAAEGEPVTRGAAERRRAAAHLDSLGRLLAVAGWPDAARTARHLRDRLLHDHLPHARLLRDRLLHDHLPHARLLRDRLLHDRLPRDDGDVVAGYARFARRVRRSRVLAWMLRGLGQVDRDHAFLAGDVLDRVHRRLDAAGDAIGRLQDRTPLTVDGGPPGDDRGDGPGSAGWSRGALELLPGLLEGAELAEARLIVASLDPDLAQLSPEAAHERGEERG